MAKKRTRDTVEQYHLDQVTALGCLVCRNEDGRHQPAEAHHILTGQGGSQRAQDHLAIPLCPDHHRHGGHGTAIHAGQQTFERLHGTELALLAQTYYCLDAGKAVAFNLPFEARPQRPAKPTNGTPA